MTGIGARRVGWIPLLAVLIGVVLCSIALAAVQRVAIALDGVRLREEAIVVDDQLYIPLAVLTRATDREASWDRSRGVVSITRRPEGRPSGGVLFEDDFGRELKREWRTDPLGSWAVANGDLVATECRGDGYALALVGDASWADHCMDVDVRLGALGLDYTPAEIGLVCRWRGARDYTAFVLEPRYRGQAYWQEVRDGRKSGPIGAQEVTFQSHGGESLHLRLVARGGQVTVYRNGEPEPFATYGSAGAAGAVGMFFRFNAFARKAPQGFAFDSFRVQRLSSAGELPTYPRFKKWASERGGGRR